MIWLLMCLGASADDARIAAIRTAWQAGDWPQAVSLLEAEAASADVFQRRRALSYLAAARAHAGDGAGALDALEGAVVAGFADSQQVRDDPAFASLLGEPRMVALLEAMARGRSAHEVGVLATPYRPTLPAAERAAGLALLWSEVRNHFAFFDQVPDLDWDARFLEAMGDVLADDSTAAYYGVLAELVAELSDGHTDVRFPPQLAPSTATPDLETRWVDGMLLVGDVWGDLPARRGDRIVAVDGVPLEQHVAAIRPRVAASTPQEAEAEIYGRLVLAGDRARPVRVTVERGSRQLDLELIRGGDHPERPPVRFHTERGVGVLAVDTFDTGQVVRDAAVVWPAISEQRGLVVDLRRNGGGNSGVGMELLSWLTDAPFATGCWQTRVAYSTDAPWGAGLAWTTPECGTYPADASRHFEGPVAVLVGPRTFSAAEDFVVAFQAMGRGAVVGLPTGGSTGQPRAFPLPGGGGFRVCAKRDTRPDGGEWVGVGLEPDVVVPLTARDFERGRDEQLVAAIEWVRAHDRGLDRGR